jgi:hypothetical protein
MCLCTIFYNILFIRCSWLTFFLSCLMQGNVVGMGVQLCVIMFLVLAGGGWSLVYPWGKILWYPLETALALWTGLNMKVKRKISARYQISVIFFTDVITKGVMNLLLD